MIRLLLSLLIVGAGARALAADCYSGTSRIGYSHAHSYGYDILNVGKRSFLVTPYAYSIGVPVAVPSYVEYNPAYGAPIIQQPYKSGAKPYSQFADEYREYLELLSQYKAIKAADYERYLELKARFSERKRRGEGGEPDSGAAAAGAGPLDGQVTEIFSTHCARCHGPSEQKAGLQLVGADGRLPHAFTQPVGALIYRKVLKGEMPPDGPLADELVDVIDRWVDSLE